MSRFGKIVLGLAVIAVVTNFAYRIITEAKKLLQYCYEFGGASVRKIGLESIDMDIILNVKNNSKIDMAVTGYDLQIYVNEKYVSTVKSYKNQIFKSGKKEPLRLRLLFNPKEVLKNVINFNNLLSFAIDKSKIIIKVSGYFSVNAGGVQVDNYPISISSTLQEILAPSPETTKCI
jgi:hypothetical protein